MLNPATITLTGSLAGETVRKTIDKSVSDAQPFGRAPLVLALAGQENALHESKEQHLPCCERRCTADSTTSSGPAGRKCTRPSLS